MLCPPAVGSDGPIQSINMALISREKVASLRQAIADHDFLHRILRKIEHLLRVVFHAHKIEWQYVRAAAEEILIADIMTRYGGQIDGVYYALRKREESGHSWEQAITDYATYCHNYFTTPLGVVIRLDLYGDDAHFITTAAGKLSIMVQMTEREALDKAEPQAASDQAAAAAVE